jgi:Spy/CpxP family protein refolding chaperone
MTPLNRMTVGVVLLTMLAAAAGGWAGIRYGQSQIHQSPGLDELLHTELDLTPEQEQQIATIEAQFAAKRRALEDEMRAANRDLAAAIAGEHVYGPSAQSAIERFHTAQSALQEETIKHILAMRDVLTLEQIARFDDAVSAALTSD